jgi:hypothetical protein
MLNKVTKLPKSRFYVFGFCEKKQFVGRNATPNMGWLVEISNYGAKKKGRIPKIFETRKKKLGIFYFYFINSIYIRVFYHIYHIYSILPPPLQQLISCLQLGEY